MNSMPPIPVDGGELVAGGAAGAAGLGTAAGRAGALVGGGAAVVAVVVGAAVTAVAAVLAGACAGAGADAVGVATGGEAGGVPVAAFPPPTSLAGTEAVGSFEQAGSAPSTAQQNDARIRGRVEIWSEALAMMPSPSW